jgi:hypothetical protein
LEVKVTVSGLKQQECWINLEISGSPSSKGETMKPQNYNLDKNGQVTILLNPCSLYRFDTTTKVDYEKETNKIADFIHFKSKGEDQFFKKV